MKRACLGKAFLLTALLSGSLLLAACGGEDVEETTRTPVPATVAPAGFFDSDGVPIHYEVFGEGKPIILVHGITSNLQQNWVDTGWVETLSATRQVVVLDNRGHGLSGKPHDPEAYEGDRMPQDVLRLMDYLDIGQADLLGYSMGAFIAIDLLAHEEGRFTSVILGGIGNGFTFSTPELIHAISDGFLAEDPSQITDPWGQGFRAAADQDPNNDLEALAACIPLLGEPIDLAALGDVKIPVLIVNGADDALARNPDELAAAIPGARLVVIPDRDHLTVVPDPRFKEEVLAFLGEQ